jgi:hypothetical protein
MFDRSLRRILHRDLNFNRSKIAIIQELSYRDMANHRISSEQLFEMLNDDGVINSVLMTDEAHFHALRRGAEGLLPPGCQTLDVIYISVSRRFFIDVEYMKQLLVTPNINEY